MCGNTIQLRRRPKYGVVGLHSFVKPLSSLSVSKVRDTNFLASVILSRTTPLNTAASDDPGLELSILKFFVFLEILFNYSQYFPMLYPCVSFQLSFLNIMHSVQ